MKSRSIFSAHFRSQFIIICMLIVNATSLTAHEGSEIKFLDGLDQNLIIEVDDYYECNLVQNSMLNCVQYALDYGKMKNSLSENCLLFYFDNWNDNRDRNFQICDAIVYGAAGWLLIEWTPPQLEPTIESITMFGSYGFRLKYLDGADEGIFGNIVHPRALELDWFSQIITSVIEKLLDGEERDNVLFSTIVD